ncbi:MAG: RNase adapter RapZ [Sandaracinaceae bacterium]|nr:RNase adapter RapZ [Sandaracinaceae bacterium]MDW8245443.1 RNase adapter RapZ [Sandaracinaceae bacterium]
MSSLHVIVVTGMSGAGRTSALRVLEDLGFYCVDNLPPQLAPALLELLSDGRARSLSQGKSLAKVGLGIDVRAGAFLEGADQLIDRVRELGNEVDVLFLDCVDEVLVRRYSETRRPHPLAPGGDVIAAIAQERERLAPLRMRATHTIDTSSFSVHELRRALIEFLGRKGSPHSMRIRLISFGFKYGIPVDADLVFDVRFLDNPHFVPSLRPLSGLDEAVQRYVINSEGASQFIEDLLVMLEHAVPRYEREGKAYLTIAVGCTGGRHRSVAVVEHIARRLPFSDRVRISHRDINRYDNRHEPG